MCIAKIPKSSAAQSSNCPYAVVLRALPMDRTLPPPGMARRAGPGRPGEHEPMTTTDATEVAELVAPRERRTAGTP
ncbi:hypothetical protein GCM10010394_35460 [Streptomyces crystallinus]|uniref:Uncharacterized protein n=1 Tax=Streptomyces crystallinus TaxID=68191 RepID=A0ABP3R548_9ACTN